MMDANLYLREIYKFRNGNEYFGLDVQNLLFFKMNKITWEVIDTYPHHDQLLHLYDPLQLKNSIHLLEKNSFLTNMLPPPVDTQVTNRPIPLNSVGLCLHDSDKGKIMPIHITRNAVNILFQKSSKKDGVRLVFITDEFEKSSVTIENTIEYAKGLEKKYNKEISFALRTGTFPLSAQNVRFLNSHDLTIEIVLTPLKGNIIYTNPNAEEIRDLQDVFTPIINNTIVTLNSDSKTLLSLEVILNNLNSIGLKMVFLDILCSQCQGKQGIKEISPRLITQAVKRHSLELKNNNPKNLKGLTNIIPLMHTVMTSRKNYYGCCAGKNYIVVSPDGDIFPCHNMTANNRFKLGHLFDDKNQILEKRITHHVDNKKKCRACGIRYFCGGGPNLETGDSKDPPVECEINRELSEYAMIKYKELDLKRKRWVIGIDNRMKIMMPYRWESMETTQIDRKSRCLKVMGSSMRPFLKEGDQVVTQPIDAEKIKIGDIICFGKPVTCHRVIWKSRSNGRLYVLEKGDRQLETSRIPADEISGKVVSITKGDKTIKLDNRRWNFLNRLMVVFSLFSFTAGNIFKQRRKKSKWKKY